MTHSRVSRHTISASPAAITKAIALAQTGTVTPLTMTSQPKMKRSNCNKAISEKKTIAMMVKGFVTFVSLAIFCVAHVLFQQRVTAFRCNCEGAGTIRLCQTECTELGSDISRNWRRIAFRVCGALQLP